jgi:hypothetical protein
MRIDQVHIKQEFFEMAQTLYGFAVSVLVFIGIGCTIYKVVSPDGWVASAFGRSLSAGFAMLGSVVALLAVAMLSRSAPRGRNALSEFLVFGFSMAGLVFLGRLWIVGTL